jgi:hypothetical protein
MFPQNLVEGKHSSTTEKFVDTNISGKDPNLKQGLEHDLIFSMKCKYAEGLDFQ